MSVDPSSASGTNPGSGGASGNEPNKNEPKLDTVAYETHQKLLSEKKKLQAERDALAKEKQDREEATLKEKEDFKKLLELREQELKEVKEAKKVSDERIQNSQKLSAMLGKISGEVEKQYWNLIDLESIVVDPATGLPDESSVVKAAQDFEAKYPLVVQKPNGAKLPNDAAKGGGGKISYDVWKDLPYKEKIARQKDVDESTL